MRRYKVIIAGPVGAGKTAAVKAVTDSHLLSTDAVVSDITSLRKNTTTVAMDYGVVVLSENEHAHIYGTPGQERFDFMWNILLKGADAIILLLDHSRNNPYRDLKYYSEALSDFIQSHPTVIGVTHGEAANNDDFLLPYQQWSQNLQLNAPVFTVDARSKVAIWQLLETVLQPIRSASNNEVMESLEQPSMQQPASASQNSFYEAEERQVLSENTLAAVDGLSGVNGVILTNPLGEILHTTISDDANNELIAFLAGMSNAFEQSLNLGSLRRITLKSPHQENITVFIEKEQSLGVLSQPKISLPILSQQIEDVLQWT